MTEKRFKLAYEKGNEAIFEDLAKYPYPRRMTNKEVENLLNEQQEMIDQLEKENKQLRKTIALFEVEEDEINFLKEVVVVDE